MVFMDDIPSPNIPAALNDPSLNKKSDIFSKRYGEYFEKAVAPVSDDIIIKDHFTTYLQILRKIEKYKRRIKSELAISNINKNEKKDFTESDIPPYYFLQDFSFRNPTIYKNLLPSPTHKLSEWLGPANNIHEKLSKYLDEIETAIAASVSQKSEGFIHALTYVGNLGDNLHNICSTIGEIRKSMSRYQSTYTSTSLKIFQMNIKLTNLYKIRDKLKIMGILCQSQPTLQILLSNNEYLGAFDLVSSSRDVLNKELHGIRSFRFLGAQLLEIENLIFRMLWAEYTAILTKHFEVRAATSLPIPHPHTASAPPHFNGHRSTPLPPNGLAHRDEPDDEMVYALLSATLDPDGTDRRNGFVDDTKSLFADLSSVVLGMLYLRNLSFIEYLKEESCTFIDGAIINKLKTGIESYYLSHNRQLGDISLADALPKLDLAAFASLMEGIFIELTLHIKKIQLFAILISVLLVAASLQAPVPDQSSDVVDNGHPKSARALGKAGTSWASLATSLIKSTSYLNGEEVSHVITEEEKVKALKKLKSGLIDIVNYTRDETAKLLTNWARNFVPSSLFTAFATPPPTAHSSSSDHSVPNGTNYHLPGNPTPNPSTGGPTVPAPRSTTVLPLVPCVSLYASAHVYFSDASHVVSQSFLGPFAPAQQGTGGGQNPVSVTSSEEDFLPAPTYSEIDLGSLSDDGSSVSPGFAAKQQDGSGQFCVEASDHNGDFYPDDKNPFNESGDETNQDFQGVPAKTSQTKLLSLHQNDNNVAKESPSDNFFNVRGKDFMDILRKLVLQSLNVYSQRIKRELNHALVRDKWKQVEISQAFQERLDEFCVNGVKNLELSDLEGHEKSGTVSTLKMGKQSYPMCNSSLVLLKTLLILMCIIKNFPFSAKFTTSVLCHLLKVFNSRTCHLLLGAGAIETAGLKSITTRHLAISLRNLEFFRDFLPVLTSHWNAVHFEKYKGLEKNLSSIANDYSKHMDEIMGKMVEIMNSNLSQHLMKWEIKAPTPSPTFQAITKQIGYFYSTIDGILSKSTSQVILTRIDILFRKMLREKIQSSNIPNDGGPRSGVVISELAFYRTSLDKLNLSVGEAEDKLFWNSIWPV